MWPLQMQTNAAAVVLTLNSNVMSNAATGDRSFQNGEKLLVKYQIQSTNFPHLTVAFLLSITDLQQKNVKWSFCM